MPYTSNDGVRIHYEVEGEGPPLVLAHGWLGTAQHWRDAGYAEALRTGYRLILIDARGHGQSDKPHEAAAYALRRHAGDVVAVLDDLGVAEARVWGYSMGGLMCCALAATAPSRLRALVVGGAQPSAGRIPTVAEEGWVRELGPGMAHFVAWFERQRGPLPAATRARWLANDAAAAAAALQALLDEAATDFEGAVRAAAVPCLLYCGTADRAHAQIRAAAERLPNATFVAVEGLDHVQTSARSDLVLPHVRAFLDRVEASEAS